MTIVAEGFGNVLTHEAQTITCPVNTVGVMGKGLAKAMRQRIRGLHDYYKSLCMRGELYLGSSAVYEIPNKDQKVLLFPTKGHWRENSDVEAIRQGLLHLAENYQAMGISELALIPLGCGLGNLDYATQVRPLIHEILGPIDLPVYVLLRDLD